MRAPLPARDLGLILLMSILALALISGIHAMLQSRIARNEQLAAMQPLLQALPISMRATASLQPAGQLHDTDKLSLQHESAFYRIIANARPMGWLIPVTADEGYGGDISLLIAIDASGEILGINVLSHRETAGLGDRIEHRHSNWLDIFNGHSLGNPSSGAWFVRKDGGQFDQMTGATVTSRAVTKAVKQALEFVAIQRAQLDRAEPNTKAADRE